MIGLRIRDDAGNLLVDETSSLATTISVVTVGTTNGSYTLPADVPGRASYAIFPGGPTFRAPVITLTNSNRTVNWTWPVSGSSSNPTFKMFIGVV